MERPEKRICHRVPNVMQAAKLRTFAVALGLIFIKKYTKKLIKYDVGTVDKSDGTNCTKLGILVTYTLSEKSQKRFFDFF